MRCHHGARSGNASGGEADVWRQFDNTAVEQLYGTGRGTEFRYREKSVYQVLYGTGMLATRPARVVA